MSAADSTAAKKTSIFKSFSRITQGNQLRITKLDAGDSQVILKWSKNHPENHYLKIAIFLVALAVASEADSLHDLKIQLIYIID